MKRRDWLIIGLVAAVSLALFLARPQAVETASDTVYLRITAPDKTYDLIPLTGEQDVTIDQADGSHNVVQVFAGGFRMKESNCLNQDCMLQGDVTTGNIAERPLANQVICLPHRVVLELVTADGQAPGQN